MDEKLAKELTEGTLRMYESLRPSMISQDNPKLRKLVKGSNLENATYEELNKIPNIMRTVYNSRYKAFRNAWTNVFGGKDVRMLKKNPAVYLDEFMVDVMKYNKDAFMDGFAERWLKMRFIKELDESRRT